MLRVALAAENVMPFLYGKKMCDLPASKARVGFLGNISQETPYRLMIKSMPSEDTRAKP